MASHVHTSSRHVWPACLSLRLVNTEPSRRISSKLTSKPIDAHASNWSSAPLSSTFVLLLQLSILTGFCSLTASSLPDISVHPAFSSLQHRAESCVYLAVVKSADFSQLQPSPFFPGRRGLPSSTREIYDFLWCVSVSRVRYEQVLKMEQFCTGFNFVTGVFMHNSKKKSVKIHSKKMATGAVKC